MRPGANRGGGGLRGHTHPPQVANQHCTKCFYVFQLFMAPIGPNTRWCGAKFCILRASNFFVHVFANRPEILNLAGVQRHNSNS